MKLKHFLNALVFDLNLHNVHPEKCPEPAGDRPPFLHFGLQK
jgi:hypothetical protein